MAQVHSLILRMGEISRCSLSAVVSELGGFDIADLALISHGRRGTLINPSPEIGGMGRQGFGFLYN